MENMLQYSICQRFGIDCKDLIAMVMESETWLNFSTELEIFKRSRCGSRTSRFAKSQEYKKELLIHPQR